MASDVATQSLDLSGLKGILPSFTARHFVLHPSPFDHPNLDSNEGPQTGAYHPQAQELSRWSTSTPQKTIEMNKAWLRVKSMIQERFNMYMQTEDCVKVRM